MQSRLVVFPEAWLNVHINKQLFTPDTQKQLSTTKANHKWSRSLVNLCQSVTQMTASSCFLALLLIQHLSRCLFVVLWLDNKKSKLYRSIQSLRDEYSGAVHMTCQIYLRISLKMLIGRTCMCLSCTVLMVCQKAHGNHSDSHFSTIPGTLPCPCMPLTLELSCCSHVDRDWWLALRAPRAARVTATCQTALAAAAHRLMADFLLSSQEAVQESQASSTRVWRHHTTVTIITACWQFTVMYCHTGHIHLTDPTDFCLSSCVLSKLKSL